MRHTPCDESGDRSKQRIPEKERRGLERRKERMCSGVK